VNNYKLVIEYNGLDFYGSQIQKNSKGEFLRTVQGELEKALSIYFKEKIASNFSSRTDAGVHALGQVLNFKCEQKLDFLDANPDKFLISLNGILPKDISSISIEEVPLSFNARFDAISREYSYKIFARKQRPVLRLDSLYWEKESLDFESMRRHAYKFLGRHDFRNYAKHEDYPRENYESEIFKSELSQESEYCFKYHISANRFLRHMVRKIVGELIAVGKGERLEFNSKPVEFTAPAQALSLIKVSY
jgi:tRNA pseudouridine38-40 synthase